MKSQNVVLTAFYREIKSITVVTKIALVRELEKVNIQA